MRPPNCSPSDRHPLLEVVDPVLDTEILWIEEVDDPDGAGMFNENPVGQRVPGSPEATGTLGRWAPPKRIRTVFPKPKACSTADLPT